MDATQEAFKGYTLTRDYGYWALIYIIFIFSLTFCSLASFEKIGQAFNMRATCSLYPSSGLGLGPQVRFDKFAMTRTDIGPISEMEGYDFLNPPSIEFPEFVYSPPPIRDLIVRPNGDLAPYGKPYDAVAFRLEAMEYTRMRGQLNTKDEEYYRPFYVYPKPNLDVKDYILLSDSTDLALRPTDLIVWERPKKF